MYKSISRKQNTRCKKYAAIACINDNSKKNEGKTEYYRKLLENGTDKMFELPMNLKGLLNMIDVSDFREKRYYLSELQRKVFSEIERGYDVTVKMLELGIPYLNSTLIYGEPGTGKTEFAKYVAYKLGLPFAYVNFSYLISSYMGSTSANIRKVFDYCKGQKCVLLLDEIDCIGLERSDDSKGVDGELARTTISLMQALDELVDGQIVIGATNRMDRLDKALLRRFQRNYEFVRFEYHDRVNMVVNFLDDVGIKYDRKSNIDDYVSQDHTQAEIMKHMIDRIAYAITENTEITL